MRTYVDFDVDGIRFPYFRWCFVSDPNCQCIGILFKPIKDFGVANLTPFVCCFHFKLSKLILFDVFVATDKLAVKPCILVIYW